MVGSVCLLRRVLQKHYQSRRVWTNLTRHKSTKSALSLPVKAYRVRVDLDATDDSAPRLERIHTSKLELITKYGFDLRDLRILQMTEEPSGSGDESVDYLTNDDESNLDFVKPSQKSRPKPKRLLSSHKYETPEFFIRPNAFLMHMGQPLSAMITSSECLLLNDPSAAVKQKFLRKLHATTNQYRTALESGTESPSEEDMSDPSSQSSSSMPFEFHCLEAACKAVSAYHRNELSQMTERVTRLTRDGKSSDEELNRDLMAPVFQLREIESDITMHISQMSSLVVEYQTLLNTPKDLRMMCSSRPITSVVDSSSGINVAHSYSPISINNNNNNNDQQTSIISGTVGFDSSRISQELSAKSDHSSGGIQFNEMDNLELLLENYLWQFEEMLHGFQLLLEDVRMHERTLQFVLDKNRNEIMQLQLRLSVLTVGFGYSAVCASIFGMNLLSHLETHPTLFYGAAFVFSAAMPFGIYRWFKYRFTVNNRIRW